LKGIPARHIVLPFLVVGPRRAAPGPERRFAREFSRPGVRKPGKKSEK
jgi:hypothetical protein